MKSQTTTRAALIAALSILAAIICIALSMQHENGDVFVEIKPIPTPKATNMISSTPLPSHAAVLQSSPTPEATLQPVYTPTATPAPMQGGRAFFTLSILNDTISVAYGVEESTLKKTPGWLTTSVLPGESGMCVVYGHRNRGRYHYGNKRRHSLHIYCFRYCHLRKHIGLAAPNAGRKYACACDLLPVQILGTCAGQVYGCCTAC